MRGVEAFTLQPLEHITLTIMRGTQRGSRTEIVSPYLGGDLRLGTEISSLIKQHQVIHQKQQRDTQSTGAPNRKDWVLPGLTQDVGMAEVG